MSDMQFYADYREKTKALDEALQGIECLFLDYNIPLPNWLDAAKQTVKQMKREFREIESDLQLGLEE